MLFKPVIMTVNDYAQAYGLMIAIRGQGQRTGDKPLDDG